MKCMMKNFETRGIGTTPSFSDLNQKPTARMFKISPVVDPIRAKYADKLLAYNKKRQAFVNTYKASALPRMQRDKILLSIEALDKEMSPLVEYDTYIKDLGIKIQKLSNQRDSSKMSLEAHKKSIESMESEIAKLMSLVETELKK